MAENTSPKISIIVPVYKVEQYLGRCLDSIAAQTFTDWECILIDDGSPDKSGDICDEYAERDSRFRVIHQKNAGVSAARNAGLDVARGEWIGFVDSDDWIETKMYEYLFNNAVKTEADCIICGFFGQSKSNFKKLCRTEKALKLLFARKGFGGFSVLRLIDAEKVKTVRFDVNVSYMEDVKFFYDAFRNCSFIYWDNEPLYHYEQRLDSVTNQTGLTESAKTALQLLEKLYQNESKKAVKNAILSMKFRFCIHLAFMYVKENSVDNNEFIFLKNQILHSLFFILFCSDVSL